MWPAAINTSLCNWATSWGQCQGSGTTITACSPPSGSSECSRSPVHTNNRGYIIVSLPGPWYTNKVLVVLILWHFCCTKEYSSSSWICPCQWRKDPRVSDGRTPVSVMEGSPCQWHKDPRVSDGRIPVSVTEVSPCQWWKDPRVSDGRIPVSVMEGSPC